MKRRASAAEMQSRDAGLRVPADDLLHAGLDHVEVLLEYQLPLSSKRVDVVLAGRHPGRDGPSRRPILHQMQPSPPSCRKLLAHC